MPIVYYLDYMNVLYSSTDLESVDPDCQMLVMITQRATRPQLTYSSHVGDQTDGGGLRRRAHGVAATAGTSSSCRSAFTKSFPQHPAPASYVENIPVEEPAEADELFGGFVADPLLLAASVAQLFSGHTAARTRSVPVPQYRRQQ